MVQDLSTVVQLSLTLRDNPRDNSIFKGQCAFADQVQRKGCSGEEFFQFTCPATARGAHEHPRYPDETGKKYQNDAVVNNLTQHKLFGVDD